jgi:sodium-dependent dicarboxylate transporter 2/3/5
MAILPDRRLEMALIIGFASSTSMLLPVSTPPNAIAYSTGVVDQKDLIKLGIIMGLLGSALVTVCVLLIS